VHEDVRDTCKALTASSGTERHTSLLNIWNCSAELARTAERRACSLGPACAALQLLQEHVPLLLSMTR
jgi:hypothetical protein